MGADCNLQSLASRHHTRVDGRRGHSQITELTVRMRQHGQRIPGQPEEGGEYVSYIIALDNRGAVRGEAVYF